MSEANITWRRSRDRMIGGVCGGIAERLGWLPARELVHRDDFLPARGASAEAAEEPDA